jgi:hypothetical protein
VADRDSWLAAVESELRAVGRELEVPPASDLTTAIRQRLTTAVTQRRRGPVARPQIPAWRSAVPGIRLGWRVALIVVAACLAVLIATPQGRAVVSHVLRFAGIDLSQQQGPVPAPANSTSLPGQRPTSLQQARRLVSFPILVPAALGPPSQVAVSDRGRVVSLIYRHSTYGFVRLDEFDGHLDQVVFEKFVHFAKVTRVKVNGARALWIEGPQELVYVTRDGMIVAASARLTAGNTLIWGTSRVALRLEGNVGVTAAVAIARSAH